MSSCHATMMMRMTEMMMLLRMMLTMLIRVPTRPTSSVLRYST